MSEDIVDRLAVMATELLGSTPVARPEAQRSADIMVEALEEILFLRRDLATQWRNWDEVTELDAKLTNVRSVAQHAFSQ